MSLINDMLQDLDRRGARGPSESDDASRNSDPDLMASAGHSTRGRSASNIGWPGLLASLAVVGLAAAVVVWWWEPSSHSAAESPEETETEIEIKAPARDSEAEFAIESEIDLGAESFERALQPRARPAMIRAVNDPVIHLPGNVDLTFEQQQYSELLERAQSARARDRLTRPSNDNAYDYYQQILVQAPHHPEAIAGLAAIARRYRELVEVALDNNDLSAAQNYIRRARSIDPQATGLDASLERLQRMSAAQATDEGEPKSSENEEEERLSVTLDMDSRDRRRAQVARELWAQGDQTGALNALEQTLDDFQRTGAQAPVSTALLVEFYLQSDDPVSAEILLEQSEDLSISEGTRLQAQLDLHRGDSSRALSKLETHLESAQENELYRALLARLYFAENRFPEAVKAYRALLSDFGQDPAYWLGLGLAEDAQEQSREALQAFLRARERGGYGSDSAIHRYLERRIDALTRQLNAQDF